MKKRGFTLVEVMIVVSIIGFLTMIAVPAFMSYRLDARRTICQTNLKTIFNAKGSWTAAHINNSTVVPGYNLTGEDINNVRDYMEQPNLTCPSGGTYDWGSVDTDPTCTGPREGTRRHGRSQ